MNIALIRSALRHTRNAISHLEAYDPNRAALEDVAIRIARLLEQAEVGKLLDRAELEALEAETYRLRVATADSEGEGWKR